jgi:hypothetical protein
VKHEKALFYAELSQLYAPAAGVIEGAHYISIRPAQGELTDLTVAFPPSATVTDVIDPVRTAAIAQNKDSQVASIVSLWRFDPDTRKLRITLNPAQSRPFTILVRSQIATGPLPLQSSVGLATVENAAGEIGLAGVATGNDVQLDALEAQGLSAINLEDFPAEALSALQSRIPGLTLRRALRYGDAKGTLSITASAVEPDIRVDTHDTVSLGEDRTVLAANATVNITRAGIFRLSFVMPSGFDVESITGTNLSHWTESKGDVGRVITLHLNGKTEGQKQFSITLAGPGLKAAKNWSVPQILFQQANKQLGTLLVVPEQGMRLQVASREGVTQLDPQKSGVRQKGVLAFRILQAPWSLAFDVEQVLPWIQVTSLQHAFINEAQVRISANLQYHIENTGLKALRVFVPTNAEAVRFQGDQLADFIAVTGSTTNGLQEWEIKLHRRIIGSYMLQLTYQTSLPEQTRETTLRGVQAAGVNLQRGFVTVRSAGRLQVNIPALPEALQPAEWQSIPRALLIDQGRAKTERGAATAELAAADSAFRLVEPAFALPIQLTRHEAAQLLSAQVNKIDLNSAISDDGAMLTRVVLEMIPGDKRLLNLTLPPNAKFWFAFVNQSGVWPWREQDRTLIPLDQGWHTGQPISVEIFYSSRIGDAKSRTVDLQLLAPKFDLPLENITWRVSLSEQWKVKDWSGSLQLQQQELAPATATVDVQSYLNTEAEWQQVRTKQAVDLLTAGNVALEKGEPQQARRAFQAAYGLSGHDAAFNEDARVQLHNIKLQQALIGLNVRQVAAAGDNSGLGAKLRDLNGRKEIGYTQQDAKDVIDRNTADDNTALMRVAERIIQQQDAAVTSPTPIRASVPDQGRILTFKRAVLGDPWQELKIALEVKPEKVASWKVRLLILATIAFIFIALGWAARRGATA